MIYTEGSHITADTANELHAFAKNCGLNRNWFQGSDRPKFNRYWIFGNARKLAMRDQPKYLSKADFEIQAKKMTY